MPINTSPCSDTPLVFQGFPVGHNQPPQHLNGYDVTILIDICKVVAAAENDGKLLPSQANVASEAEKAELLRRVKQRKDAQDACVRAEIILTCAEGESGNAIAQRLGVSKGLVSRWRLGK